MQDQLQTYCNRSHIYQDPQVILLHDHKGGATVDKPSTEASD